MKIACLGMGVWGYTLASLLAAKGIAEVVCWSRDSCFLHFLETNQQHPGLVGHSKKPNLTFTASLAQAIAGADLIVESVTSSGFRSVLNQLLAFGVPNASLVITSKGIEQHSGAILPEIALEVFGDSYRRKIGCLTGPSFAQDVIRNVPTSVVASGYDKTMIQRVVETFTTSFFRVYPNSDIFGTAFGGALKNVIAIACGISDGLELGPSAKAALMTRGLHEIRKLAVAYGCKPETMYGLAGLGDLSLTCSSPKSRNFHFGMLLAEGFSPTKAQEMIGMVVEGAFTALSAKELSKKYKIETPITETVYKIIYEDLHPQDAVKLLMQRAIKEEHL